MRLLNKVAVITGAASGIGKEIARAYLREGAKLVTADLNQAGADATAAELGGKDAIGGAAYGVRANVICPGFVRTPTGRQTNSRAS